MARQKRKSPALDAGTTRAAAFKSVDPALDFGNGVSLTALNASLTNVKTKLDKYNTLLSETDDALNVLEVEEKNVSDLCTRLLAGVKTKYGADSSEYEMAGGTRTSEIKRSPRKQAVTK